MYKVFVWYMKMYNSLLVLENEIIGWLFLFVIQLILSFFCRNKFPIEELIELFPEGSGNLRSENFVPAWFLLENHHMTKFEDLKYGLKFLNRKVNSQTEGKLSFLKVEIKHLRRMKPWTISAETVVNVYYIFNWTI
jgi:hypothetical protein